MGSREHESFSFTRSFVRGEAHLGFWSFVKKGTGALDSFFILSSLTLYQFGVYQLLLSAYAILSDFFHDVFGEVVTNDLARLIGEKREDKAKKLFFEYAAFRMVMAAIPCAAVFLALPHLPDVYGRDIAAAAPLIGLLFLADALVLISTLLVKLRLQFAVLAPRASAQKFIQFLALAGFYFFGRIGLREIFVSQIAAAVGVVLVMLPAIVRGWAPWRQAGAYPHPILRGIVNSYGTWALPQSFLTDFTGKIRPWLIRLFLNTETVGIFGVANAFVSAIKDLLPIRTPGMIVPRKTEDQAAMARFWRYGTKYYVWLGAALSLAGAAGVPPVVRFLFPKFTASLPVFYLLLVSIPIFAMTKPSGFLLVAFRRQKFLFWQAVFQGALSFVLLAALLPTVGIMGLALAEIAAIAASAALRGRALARAGLAPPFRLGSLFVVETEDRMYLSMLADHARRMIARGRRRTV